MEKRNALIAGATGLVGSHLLQQLLADDQYGKILAITRKPLEIVHDKLTNLQIDFDALQSLEIPFEVDDVYCALGTTIRVAGSKEAFYKVDFTYVTKLGNWCAARRAKRLMVVSSMGANAKSGIFYNRVKGKMEMAISKLAIKQIQIFRPSLLMGNRNEMRAGEKMAQRVMGAIGFLFVGPLLKYKGIYACVVARAMIKSAKSDLSGVVIYESGELQKSGME